MKRLIIISLILFGHNVFAQNLVPNPSFEDTIQCPISNGNILDTEHWYSPTIGTPDFFHSCNGSSLGIPINSVGSQYARTGEAYAGIVTLDTINLQSNIEYIRIELIDTLVSEQCYDVSFFFSVADLNSFAVLSRDIGIQFTNTSIISPTYVLTYNPSNTIIDTNCIDTLNCTDWIEVSGEYYANGGERFITIGVFHTDTFCSSSTCNSIYFPGSVNGYCYIDDVSVIPCPVDSTSENKWECINGTCVDTVNNGTYTSLADCEAYCEQVGISEQKQTKTLLKIIDVLGRETKPQPNVPLFYIYDDGTVEKRIIIK